MTTTAILTPKSRLSYQEKSSKLNSVDGWRAVACLMVLFHHTGFRLHLGSLTVLGSTGVVLFFVLSGYLLYAPICKGIWRGNFIDLKLYFIRRFLRIYPAYLVALVVYSIARYLTGLHPPSAGNLLAHVLMIFNTSKQREFFGIAVMFWTLAIESQFYILLPVAALIAYFCFKGRPVLSIFTTPLLFLCIGLIARALELCHPASISADGLPSVRYNTTFSFLDLFACGMLIASFRTTAHALSLNSPRNARIVFLLGLAIFLIANTWCSNVLQGDWQLGENFLCMWLFPILASVGTAGMLFGVLVHDSFPGSWLAFRPLRYVGRISYSIYLFHILVQLPMFSRVPLAGVTDPSLREFCWGLISLGPTLLVATVVFRTVEEPLMKLATRFKESPEIERRLQSFAASFSPSNESAEN